MAVPYTFASATSAIPLSELDANFAYLVSQLSGVSAVSNRNRFDNGDFLFSQRFGAGSISLPAATVTPTCDRWLASVNGASSTCAVGSTAPYPGISQIENYLQINGANSCTQPTFIQRIESLRSRDLAGGSVSLSFWVFQNTGVSININAAVSRANATDNFSSQTTDFTFTLLPSSVPTGVWTYVSGTGTLSAAAITGLAVSIYSTAALPVGTYIQLAEAQFEAGAVPTPFERVHPQQSLARCQRYFYAFSFADVIAVAPSTTSLLFGHNHPVTMRTAPTLQVSVPIASVQTSGGTSTSYSLAQDATTTTMAGYYLSGMNNGPTAAYQAARVQGGTMWWSAEL